MQIKNTTSLSAYPIDICFPILAKSTMSPDKFRELKVVNNIFSQELEVVPDFNIVLELYRYSYRIDLLYDVCCGIFYDITTNRINKFEDISFNENDSWIKIKLKPIQFFKYALGLLVNENFYAIKYAGSIVQKIKKELNQMIKNNDIPRTFVSVIKSNGERVLIYGQPVIIKNLEISKKESLLELDMSRYFFPIKKESDRFKSEGMFIPQITGLSAALRFGKKIYESRKRPEKTIQAITAKKIILASQIAYSLQNSIFGNNYVEKSKIENQTIISFKREAIKELYPEAIAVRSTTNSERKQSDKINLQSFENALELASNYYQTALEELGYIEEPNLFVQMKNLGILIPKKIENTETDFEEIKIRLQRI